MTPTFDAKGGPTVLGLISGGAYATGNFAKSSMNLYTTVEPTRNGLSGEITVDFTA